MSKEWTIIVMVETSEYRGDHGKDFEFALSFDPSQTLGEVL